LRVLTQQLGILQVDNARRLDWSWQDTATRRHPARRHQAGK
jgi:hypothetical protein